jgi:hypothetical protein
MDKYIGVSGNNERLKQRFRRITYPLYVCTKADDEFMNFIIDQQETNTTVFFIVSGTLGEEVVPLIYNFPCIKQIYIYCGNISKHMNWAFDYIEKILMFDFDEELLIRLTKEIADYLVDVATGEEARGNIEQSCGLLDWADWLYNDLITIQQPFSKTHRAQIRQKRQNLNTNHHIQYPNKFPL